MPVYYRDSEGEKEIDAQMCFLREKLINLSGKKCQESLCSYSGKAREAACAAGASIPE